MAEGDPGRSEQRSPVVDSKLRRSLVRYCRDLGWRDPLYVPAPQPVQAAEHTPKVPAGESTSLEDLARSLQGCTSCPLCEKRSTVVFGEGDPEAALMFIGEGPGGEEDRTGRPFVGQAGHLLDKMIEATGFQRSQVYIANVVKCRPPGNRDPKDEEMDACEPLLDRQIELIRPQVIVALGRVAARRLTGSAKPMGALRGRWSSYRGIPLTATYHPAYLLRSPREKRSAWSDIKAVLGKLGEAGS